MRGLKSAIIVAALALAIPGNSCGPFFTEMIFVQQSAPSNLKDFLDGHILSLIHI